MASGNKGLAGLIAGAGEGALEPRRPPRTGILGARDNRLAELATGGLISRTHEAVDPAVCRIWDGHNRDYAALNAERCKDLIESFKAQGRQEVPAIVRRVTGDPVFRYEVICGARRHWTVSWLRSHDYPGFKFVVEPRELSDEEAFRVADLENRSREDLSDYERAVDYARAIDRYYDGSQQRMVERLGVTKSWMSRYLELAKLPAEVLACFETRHSVGITHAATLAPILNNPVARLRLLDEAVSLAAEQRSRIENGIAAFTPAQVVVRLSTVRDRNPKSPPRPRDIVDSNGKLIMRVHDEGRSGVSFSVPRARVSDATRVADEVKRYLESVSADR